MKVTYSTGKYQPNVRKKDFIDRIIENACVYKIIDQIRVRRKVKAIFRYSDLIRSYLLLTLCGGECAEDSSNRDAVKLSPSVADDGEVCPINGSVSCAFFNLVFLLS